jgi:hypothetical protein
LGASAAGLLVLAAASAASPTWAVELGLGLLGAGVGLTMPPATGAIMSSLPPHKAGVGSAVNDLIRELGGAFGIGVLGSLTLSHYRSGLAPVLSHQEAQVAGPARAGLAQALTSLGGAHSAAGAAARNAYSSGLDLAMVAGAVLVAAAAIVVHLALPAGASRITCDAGPGRGEPGMPLGRARTRARAAPPASPLQARMRDVGKNPVVH